MITRRDFLKVTGVAAAAAALTACGGSSSTSTASSAASSTAASSEAASAVEMCIRDRHYNVARAGEADFIKVPVDGSSKMPDAHMDAIEPFDYSAIQPFSTAYLPGFLADRYDEDEEKCLPRATRRMENTTRAALRETIDGYSEVHTKAENINIDIRKAHYALLPVWMLHTRWNDKDFLFAMNVQTCLLYT